MKNSIINEIEKKIDNLTSDEIDFLQKIKGKKDFKNNLKDKIKWK